MIEKIALSIAENIHKTMLLIYIKTNIPVKTYASRVIIIPSFCLCPPSLIHLLSLNFFMDLIQSLLHSHSLFASVSLVYYPIEDFGRSITLIVSRLLLHSSFSL